MRHLRRLRHFLLVLAVLTLTGCLPLSVNPLYTGQEDIVFDEALLGQWTAGPEEPAWGIWNIELDPDRPNGYALAIVDENDQIARFRATLVQIGERRFLDFEPVGVEPDPEMNPWFAFHLVPMRSFMRITVAKGGLAVAFPDSKGIDDLLRARPELVEHVWITNKAADGRLLLTADSASLQAFVRDHLDDDTFFDDGQMLVPVVAQAPQEQPVAPAEAEPGAEPESPMYD